MNLDLWRYQWRTSQDFYRRAISVAVIVLFLCRCIGFLSPWLLLNTVMFYLVHGFIKQEFKDAGFQMLIRTGKRKVYWRRKTGEIMMLTVIIYCLVYFFAMITGELNMEKPEYYYGSPIISRFFTPIDDDTFEWRLTWLIFFTSLVYETVLQLLNLFFILLIRNEACVLASFICLFGVDLLGNWNICTPEMWIKICDVLNAYGIRQGQIGLSVCFLLLYLLLNRAGQRKFSRQDFM